MQGTARPDGTTAEGMRGHATMGQQMTEEAKQKVCGNPDNIFTQMLYFVVGLVPDQDRVCIKTSG